MRATSPTRPRSGPLLILFAAVAVLLAMVVPGWLPGAGPGTAAAQEGTRGGAAGSEAAIVMDASSSMLQPDEGGTRLDVAKRAATEMVRALPETARIGMLAYGTEESDAPDNREAGCADIRTLAPVGAVDKEELTGEIERLTARGYTPIGNALRAAADELDGEGERSIVLVSDGIDTCAPPDPCEVAAELADEGIGLTVHAIGFKVDPAAREQLECLTQATGGQFRQADDAGSLSESLRFLTQRSIVDYESAGTEFEFADTSEDAKFLGEGLYQTRVTAEATDATAATGRYIAIAVPDGHTAYVSGTIVPVIELGESNGGQRYALRIEPSNADEGCRYASSPDSANTDPGGFSPPEAAVAIIRSDEVRNCPADQWLVEIKAAVGRFVGAAEQEVTVELSVQFEPDASSDELGTMPAGDAGHGRDLEEPAPLPLDDPADTAPGNSFNTATLLEEGAHRASIVPGESHFYRIPVGWNQRPVVTLRSGPSAREVNERLSFHLDSPLRKEIGSGVVRPYRAAEEGTATVNRLVNYRNREENLGGRERSVAGDHYLVVTMNVTTGTGGDAPFGVDQPYEFAVALEGEPADGPGWRPVTEPGPEPTDGPPGERGGDADRGDGGTATGDEGDDDETTTASGEDDSPVWPWIAGGGLLVALFVAAVVVALVSRRR